MDKQAQGAGEGEQIIGTAIERRQDWTATAVPGSATDWRIYHSALSRCAELLDNMADNDALVDTPVYLKAKLDSLATTSAEPAAMPARRFINVTGFIDADYVEFAEGCEHGGGVQNGVAYTNKHYTRANAEEYVREGSWREVPIEAGASPVPCAQGGNTCDDSAVSAPPTADVGGLTRYRPNGVNHWPQPHSEGEFFKADDVCALLATKAAQPDALPAIRRLIDGSQPKDIPGAIMVIDSAIAGRSWTYDISPPPGFIAYVKANYSGDVNFHDPEWHALRLWNAAMRNVSIGASPAPSASASPAAPGFVLVPVVPTPEMLEAAQALDGGDDDVMAAWSSVYAAMLAASPAAAVAAPTAQDEQSELVTLESARQAIAYVAHYNGPGREQYALGMLTQAAPVAGSQHVPTRLDLLSLIHSQMHRVYTSAIDREEVDIKYMREIEEGLRALAAAAPAVPVPADQDRDAAPNQWLPIKTLPYAETEALVWLRRGDSIEGPRIKHPNDYRDFSEWALCAPPGDAVAPVVVQTPLVPSFDCSLASTSAYDPQSFIDGAKWAQEKLLAGAAPSLQQPKEGAA